MFAPKPLSHDALAPEGLPATPWRFLWLFIRRRFWGRTLLLNLMAAGGVGTMGMEPVAMKALVDALSGGDRGAGWTGEVLFWFAMLGVLWVVSALFNRGREVVDIYTSPAMRHEIQYTLFSYLIGHSPRYFQDNFAGKLGQKVKQAGQSAVQLLEFVSNDVIRIILVLSIALTLLYGANAFFAALLVGWTVVQLGVSVLLARRCLSLSHTFAEEVSASSGAMVDVLGNVELVRAFVRKPFEMARLAVALDREEAASRRQRWFLTGMWFILFNALLVFQITLLGLAVREALAGRMSVGDFAMVFSLASLVGMNVWALSSRMLHFFDQLGMLSGSLSDIVIPHTIIDRPGVPALNVTVGGIALEHILFDHGDGSPVFDGLSLTIRPGEKVALVGPSGAGKSTLVKLLRRQFDPQGGRVLIDGQDVAGVTLASLNGAIAEVPQSPALFHRTIRENIAYARPEATEAEIIAAAVKAHCHDFIRRRDAGYDAVVGEQGIRLSGGERQRIAIARAFLKNAPILVLDEATSALDSETEHLIQSALWDLFQGRTVIAIAHRLSTVTGMDRILYLEQGRVLESGSHTDLMALNGRYARLWNRQVGGFLQE